MQAIVFAAQCHKNQVRKYHGEPYILHPIRVMETVQKECRCVCDLTLAAAVLHDVVEDCGVTVAEIRDRFGEDVAGWVDELTDKSTPADGNRAARKKIDNLRLADASATAQNIKLADILDNCEDIARSDPDFAKVYIREKLATIACLNSSNFGFRKKVLTRLTELLDGLSAAKAEA